MIVIWHLDLWQSFVQQLNEPFSIIDYKEIVLLIILYHADHIMTLCC